jgi:hypothetical protein
MKDRNTAPKKGENWTRTDDKIPLQLPNESRNFALHHAYDAYHPYHIVL